MFGFEAPEVRYRKAVLSCAIDAWNLWAGIWSDIDLVVLSNRHKGETLSPIHEFPCFVFVARPLITDIQIREEITRNELEIVGWGELYRTRADAVNHVFAS